MWLFPSEASNDDMSWWDEETKKLPVVKKCCCGGDAVKEPHYDWCDVHEEESDDD
jgi:hypothetical protein